MSDETPDVEKWDGKERHREDDGRAAKIDTGYYTVQAWGDTDDSFEEVVEKTERLADRAKGDVKDLNDKMDGGDKSYK